MRNLLRRMSESWAVGRRSSAVAAKKKPRLRVEQLEDRLVPAVTDMTQLAQLFPRHAGPTMLYLNFDGNSGQNVSSFQSTTGDRARDIQEILYRTAEIFSPFDVQVVRVFGNGTLGATSGGATTIFIGEDSDNGTGTANVAYAYTPFANCDYPGSVLGTHHQPNSNPYDIAFVDPIYGSSSTSWSNTTIAQAVAHEAGHTFGLAHVLTSPSPEVMSYDASNTRFVNQTFSITNLNNNGTSLVNDSRLQPQWYQRYTFVGFTIELPVNIVTQNSYTYLQSVLGSRSAAGDYANVADASTVDSAYVDGSRPSLSVGSSVTAYLQTRGDFDVYQLYSSYTRTVQINVTRPTGSTVDPVVYVFDSNGRNLLAFNDDSGGTLNSRLIFTLTGGQSYRVVVGSYGDNSTGQYQIGVSNYYSLVSDYVLYDSISLVSLSGSGSSTGGAGSSTLSGAGSVTSASSLTTVSQAPLSSQGVAQPSRFDEAAMRQLASRMNTAPRVMNAAALNVLDRGVFASLR